MTSGPNQTMRAVRLHSDSGIAGLQLDEVPIPVPSQGEVLVRVQAAALTRDELTWPVDRLPAIPSYELSGTVVTGAGELAAGTEVFGLAAFDRDGAAVELIAIPAQLLAPKPARLTQIEAASLPLAGLSAWQGLFDHGGLEAGQRVLIHGAAGGVGHLATQLAHWRGAHVIGTATGAHVDEVLALGADEVVDRDTTALTQIAPVDLVFDTVGGAALADSPKVLAEGGRIVSVAEEMPEGVTGTYFVVEPNGEQLAELGRLASDGSLRVSVGSTFALADFIAAFERFDERGKSGKVVLVIGD